jgi:hypothetical protein
MKRRRRSFGTEEIRAKIFHDHKDHTFDYRT